MMKICFVVVPSGTGSDEQPDPEGSTTKVIFVLIFIGLRTPRDFSLCSQETVSLRSKAVPSE